MSFGAKKTFGQHFLTDTRVVKRMVEAAHIQKGERVVEIGPGKGILTRELVAAQAQVTAIELDRDMVFFLKETFGQSISLIEADALSVPLPPQPYKVVANIPYNITSPLLSRYLAAENKPSRLILLLQKEVVDRLTAKPPSMSLLSVMCQLYAHCERLFSVSAESFSPKPRVDSAVIQLDTHMLVNNPERIIFLAKIGFSSRRKQLQKNLTSCGRWNPEQIAQSMTQLKYPLGMRAQNMTVEDWIHLASLLYNSELCGTTGM